MNDIHFRSDTNRTGAEGLSFYYPRLLYCLNQMPAVMLLSQHRVSSSKTVRPCASCGARCIGHAVSTWSAVCSEAPHSQFGEGARPHLCMDKWNRPTPVHRRLSLTQAARGKPIPTGLAPVKSTEPESIFTVLRFPFVIHLFRSADAKSGKVVQRFRAPDTNGRLDLNLTWQYLRTHLKDYRRYDRGPEIYSEPRRVSLPFGETQLAGCCARVQVGGPLEWDAGIQ